MLERTPNDAAFPLMIDHAGPVCADGLTVREWYAGMALAGLCADSEIAGYAKDKWEVTVARLAFKVADAMLAESKKQ